MRYRQDQGLQMDQTGRTVQSGKYPEKIRRILQEESPAVLQRKLRRLLPGQQMQQLFMICRRVMRKMNSPQPDRLPPRQAIC